MPAMLYKSTHSLVSQVPFSNVLLSSYAVDGGLYLPEVFPSVPWESWLHDPYADLLTHLLPYFISEDEISRTALKSIIDEVYTEKNFDHQDIAPLKVLNDGIIAMELFHGPTWAFKDYSLLLFGKLLQHLVSKRKEHAILLVTTSGDTGSSAIEAVKGQDHVDIITVLPKGWTSEIQERQMTTVLDKNVHVFAAEGNSDELDLVARRIFDDHQFCTRFNISSLNSINWTRILIQMGHWFYCYLWVVRNGFIEMGNKLTVSVPSGACGNITAGIICHKLGLPVDIVACTGPNSVVANFINFGIYEPQQTVRSLAPSIDIQYPYNVERILYLLCNAKQFSDPSDSFCLLPSAHALMRKVLRAHVSSNEDILTAVRKCRADNGGYLICPHSACAFSFAFQNTGDRPIVCICTAAPRKFADTISVDLPDFDRRCIETLLRAPSKYVLLQRENNNWLSIWEQQIRSKVVKIADSHEYEFKTLSYNS